jgi:hypothetical protein
VTLCLCLPFCRPSFSFCHQIRFVLWLTQSQLEVLPPVIQRPALASSLIHHILTKGKFYLVPLHKGLCVTSWKVAGLIHDGATVMFDIILPAASTSSGNEYQEYFVLGKGGRCVALTLLPPSCADCHAVWEPQLLELRAVQGLLYRLIVNSVHCAKHVYILLLLLLLLVVVVVVFP